jgi:predicted metalloenzyme YecM
MNRLKKQFSDVFNAYALEGAERQGAVLSHVCFKFSSMQAYAEYVAAAREIGSVTQEEFKGKQISWCRLNEPLQKGSHKLEWLEIIEPREEKNDFDGIANLGYYIPSLPATVKAPSTDGKMMFRYQPQHARDMAPKP